MTEEEAKTKWCPLSSVLVTIEAKSIGATPLSVDDKASLATYNMTAANRALQPFADPNASRCIGSACMMFRIRANHVWCGAAGIPP